MSAFHYVPGQYATPPEPTPDEAHRAALTICGYARNVDDARALLDTLGLLPHLQKKTHSRHPEQKTHGRRLTDQERVAIRTDYTAGATQRELADRYGVSPMTISLVVRDIRRPSPRTRAIAAHQAWRARLSDTLGAPVSLDRLSDAALEKAHRIMQVQAGRDHPDAWVWAELLGAEKERRSAYRARVAGRRRVAA